MSRPDTSLGRDEWFLIAAEPSEVSINTADTCPSSSYGFQEMVRLYIVMSNRFEFLVYSLETILSPGYILFIKSTIGICTSYQVHRRNFYALA